MAEYVFSYLPGTNHITFTRGGHHLDWNPNIPGLTVMATFAKRVFYADLVKDMQVKDGVTGAVSVIQQNFGGQYSEIPTESYYVNTASINTIKTIPLEDFKRDMKDYMRTRGTYVENPNIPKSSTSGVNPKQFSNATRVYYDSGESPSDICLNPNITHLVDSAYCLDPASGTKHPKKDFINYSFTVDNSITGGLFGFPTYYTFTTIPVDPPEKCHVRYTLNPIVPGSPNNLDVAFNIADQKNTAFNAGYSNAAKNNFITTRNTNPTRPNNEIIKKLVIKESGDCAQIWSILCELIIRIEESYPMAELKEKQARFDTLRAETLLITTDSVVFSRAIPFCSASDNGGMAGIDRGCFTQKYFTPGKNDYPLAYITQMDREKKRITDQNNVNINIFKVMRNKTFLETKPFYFYRLIDIPESRRPKKELLYNQKVYNLDCLKKLCDDEIVRIKALNTALTTEHTRDHNSVENEANLTQALKDDFLHMESFACRLYFSKDPLGNYMVHDILHTEIQKCLIIPDVSMKAAAAYAVGSDDDEDPDANDPVKDAEDYFRNQDNYEETVFKDFKCYTDYNEEINDHDEDEEDFSYYDCLVAYMILQNGLDQHSQEPEYASVDDGTIKIQVCGFLEKYDTFIDKYKREPQNGQLHVYVQDFIDNMVEDDIKVRQIGGGCLREILGDFLVRKEDMRMRRSVALGVDNSSSSSNSSNSQRNPFDVGENGTRDQPYNRSNNISSFFDATTYKARRNNINPNSSVLSVEAMEPYSQMQEESLGKLFSNSQNDLTVAAASSKGNMDENMDENELLNYLFASPGYSKNKASNTYDRMSKEEWDLINAWGAQKKEDRRSRISSSEYDNDESSQFMTPKESPQSTGSSKNSAKAETPLSQTTVTADLDSVNNTKQKNTNSIKAGLANQEQYLWSEIFGPKGGKRRTMKAKKYLKNNGKKTIRNNKKTLRKTIRKHKKTRKTKS